MSVRPHNALAIVAAVALAVALVTLGCIAVSVVGP